MYPSLETPVLNEWPLHKNTGVVDIRQMLNRLTLECIGSKKRFTVRKKLDVCRYKILQLKTMRMACIQDHSEMKKHLNSKG